MPSPTRAPRRVRSAERQVGARGERPRARQSGQAKPNKSKSGQTKPSKSAWIYLVLFVRIGAFQWVTANPNKNLSPPVTLCPQCHTLVLSFATLTARSSSIRPTETDIAHILDFEKSLHVENYRRSNKMGGIRFLAQLCGKTPLTPPCRARREARRGGCAPSRCAGGPAPSSFRKSPTRGGRAARPRRGGWCARAKTRDC